MKIIDLHCDTIVALAESLKESELWQNIFQVDIQKLKAANSLAQFFALYIDLKNGKDPLEWGLSLLDRFYQELAKNQDDIQLARSYQELCDNSQAGKISAFLTIEEGGALKGQLVNLRNFYRLGVRLITLTWNYPNEIGFPNHQWQYAADGLTTFGRDVVTEMNELGMIIDVSHLSDQGFYDVACLSTKPFIASHSNSRAVTNHTRNLSDDMIKVLAQKGGIMGINFAKDFLGSIDISRVEDMVRHIKHIHRVGGIEVIALGSDFDGINPNLEIKNIGEINKLIRALRAVHFSEADIEKICYQNAMRLLRDTLN
ncbi:MAG TPA: dipeptidase [Negativicutes bacterium]|jgi:membrane dipeptidase